MHRTKESKFWLKIYINSTIDWIWTFSPQKIVTLPSQEFNCYLCQSWINDICCVKMVYEMWIDFIFRHKGNYFVFGVRMMNWDFHVIKIPIFVRLDLMIKKMKWKSFYLKVLIFILSLILYTINFIVVIDLFHLCMIFM